MQAVPGRFLIGIEFERMLIEYKSRVTNAIGIRSDRGPNEKLVMAVVGDVGITQHGIDAPARRRHLESPDSRTEIQDLETQAACRLEHGGLQLVGIVVVTHMFLSLPGRLPP